MLVTVPQTLTITEQFNLDRFNQIELYAGEGEGSPVHRRISRQPSIPVHPDQRSRPAGYADHLKAIGARTITYDDGLNRQNQPIDFLDGFDPDDEGRAHARRPGEPGYDTATAPRMGDTVTGLTGVLGFGPAGAYRRPRGRGRRQRLRACQRAPGEAADVGGTLQVGSFNVLNYFTTLDAGGNTTANGLEPRGANTAAEFERQTEQAGGLPSSALDADVLGLVELENNFKEGAPGNALEYLVEQLNAAAGTDVYDWVRPGQEFVGGDAIAVGMIYKPGEVPIAPGHSGRDPGRHRRPAGLFWPESTAGGIFNGENASRAALAVTFEEIGTGGEFTAVANHFKSKSGDGTGEDADQVDGAGRWNNQRELAAKALTEWLGTNPTGTDDGDALLLGDLNSYFQEDPIDILKAAGYRTCRSAIETLIPSCSTARSARSTTSCRTGASAGRSPASRNGTSTPTRPTRSTTTWISAATRTTSTVRSRPGFPTTIRFSRAWT